MFVTVGEADRLRVWVLDGSQVLPTLVLRLAPEGVEAEDVSCFESAIRRFDTEPPDALIVNLAPSDLPWADLIERCHRHDPPIPLLLESCVYSSPAEAGIDHLSDDDTFLAKPCSTSEFRDALRRLFAAHPAEPVH